MSYNAGERHLQKQAPAVAAAAAPALQAAREKMAKQRKADPNYDALFSKSDYRATSLKDGSGELQNATMLQFQMPNGMRFQGNSFGTGAAGAGGLG